MARRTLQELIAAQQAGTIGRRGLQRLAALDEAHASSGADLGLTRDPAADLQARRAALYGRALEASHNLQPGQTLSAGLQRRLALGAGGTMSRDTFAPHSQQEVANLAPQYDTIMAALRKRIAGGGIASQAGIYRGFR